MLVISLIVGRDSVAGFSGWLERCWVASVLVDTVVSLQIDILRVGGDWKCRWTV